MVLARKQVSEIQPQYFEQRNPSLPFEEVAVASGNFAFHDFHPDRETIMSASFVSSAAKHIVKMMDAPNHHHSNPQTSYPATHGGSPQLSQYYQPHETGPFPGSYPNNTAGAYNPAHTYQNYGPASHAPGPNVWYPSQAQQPYPNHMIPSFGGDQYGGNVQPPMYCPPMAPPTGPSPTFPMQQMNMVPAGFQAHGGPSSLPLTPGSHTTPYPRTLKVIEDVASATQDSFTIKDMSGTTLYKVEGTFTVSEKKILRDMHGRELLHIKEARMKLREKITISDFQGLPILTVQQAGAFQAGGKKAFGYLGNNTSGNPILVISGDHGASNFRVSGLHGQEFAVIHRKKNSLRHRVTGQDSYETTVMPGVDAALVSMITVAIDEIWAD